MNGRDVDERPCGTCGGHGYVPGGVGRTAVYEVLCPDCRGSGAS